VYLKADNKDDSKKNTFLYRMDVYRRTNHFMPSAVILKAPISSCCK